MSALPYLDWARRTDAVGDVRMRVILDMTVDSFDLRAQDNGFFPVADHDVEWDINGQSHIGAHLELPRDASLRYEISCRVMNREGFDDVKITIHPYARSVNFAVLDALRANEREIGIGSWAEAVAMVWMAQLLGQGATYKSHLGGDEYVVYVWTPVADTAHYTFGGGA